MHKTVRAFSEFGISRTRLLFTHEYFRRRKSLFWTISKIQFHTGGSHKTQNIVRDKTFSTVFIRNVSTLHDTTNVRLLSLYFAATAITNDRVIISCFFVHITTIKHYYYTIATLYVFVVRASFVRCGNWIGILGESDTTRHD